MQTFFKNKTKDWYKNVTVFNADPYPNQDKFTPEQLAELNSRFPDGKTPKTNEVAADAPTKTILDNATKDLLDYDNINLIDITAHVEGDKVFGIINYRVGEQHLQKRF